MTRALERGRDLDESFRIEVAGGDVHVRRLGECSRQMLDPREQRGIHRVAGTIVDEFRLVRNEIRVAHSTRHHGARTTRSET